MATKGIMFQVGKVYGFTGDYNYALVYDFLKSCKGTEEERQLLDRFQDNASLIFTVGTRAKLKKIYDNTNKRGGGWPAYCFSIEGVDFDFTFVDSQESDDGSTIFSDLDKEENIQVGKTYTLREVAVTGIGEGLVKGSFNLGFLRKYVSHDEYIVLTKGTKIKYIGDSEKEYIFKLLDLGIELHFNKNATDNVVNYLEEA